MRRVTIFAKENVIFHILALFELYNRGKANNERGNDDFLAYISGTGGNYMLSVEELRVRAGRQLSR